MTDTAPDARRTALVLAGAQAVLGSAAPICLALGGLAGHYLLDADKSLATLPVTGFTLGVALGAVPAAVIIRLLGQRLGFATGALMTGSGGGLAAIALFRMDFVLFVAALGLIGVGGAFIQQFRFAAADNAPPQFKAKAISYVLGGGLVTAILGPQIVILTRDMFLPTMFAGAFVSIIGLAVAGMAILAMLPAAARRGEAVAAQEPARPLGAIVMQPGFALGLLCGVSTYALMSFVMTGAPLAMVGCGFSTDEATLGISLHVMAMFGPSFFTGRLITRFGKEAVMAAGLALLIGCALVAMSGIALWQFWAALVLLGLGWNFGFIGSTAMIAETYRPSEKSKVAGLHDLILFGTVALSSLSSGMVYYRLGWNALNMVVLPVSALCLGALLWRYLSRRAAAPDAAA
ncbi:MAG: MFS transporter [Rhizobiaceae bacterium]